MNPEKQLSPAIKPFKMICAGKKGRMLKNLKRPENRGLLQCLSRHWNSSFRLQRVPEQNLNMLNRFRLDLSGSSGNYQLRFCFEKVWSASEWTEQLSGSQLKVLRGQRVVPSLEGEAHGTFASMILLVQRGQIASLFAYHSPDSMGTRALSFPLKAVTALASLFREDEKHKDVASCVSKLPVTLTIYLR